MKPNWADILKGRDELTIISFRAIWAHAILFYGKDVENRSNSSFNNVRGLVGVHASKVRPIDDTKNAFDYKLITGDNPDFEVMETLCGHLVGVVNVTDCHRKSSSISSTSRWAEAGYNQLILEKPHAVEPFIPIKRGEVYPFRLSVAELLKQAARSA